MKKYAFLLVIMNLCIQFIYAQKVELPDSLAYDFRAFVAKNFQRYRTVNLFWETELAHGYTFSLDGKEVEKMKKKDLHTIKFSTMIPILKQKRISLYGNLQYNCYQFKTYNKYDNSSSSIFLSDKYDYFVGGLTGSYYMSLFNKPFILSGSISIDAWNDGFEKIFGSFSAIMVVKNDKRSNFSVGVIGRTLFSSMPIMPFIAYWHRFNNPNLSIEIAMPGQFYLRYQMKKQRISVGASMSSDNFYLKTNLKDVPELCFYTDAVLKPEIHYEYIINKHLYLSVHTGISMIMKTGLYKKNRKGVKMKDEDGKTEVEPIVKMDRSSVPFFNLGISYSLFK